MVVVISQRAAERLWPGQDPIGQEVRLGAAGCRQSVLSCHRRRRQHQARGGGGGARPRVLLSLHAISDQFRVLR